MRAAEHLSNTIKQDSKRTLDTLELFGSEVFEVSAGRPVRSISYAQYFDEKCRAIRSTSIGAVGLSEKDICQQALGAIRNEVLDLEKARKPNKARIVKLSELYVWKKMQLDWTEAGEIFTDNKLSLPDRYQALINFMEKFAQLSSLDLGSDPDTARKIEQVKSNIQINMGQITNGFLALIDLETESTGKAMNEAGQKSASVAASGAGHKAFAASSGVSVIETETPVRPVAMTKARSPLPALIKSPHRPFEEDPTAMSSREAGASHTLTAATMTEGRESMVDTSFSGSFDTPATLSTLDTSALTSSLTDTAFTTGEMKQSKLKNEVAAMKQGLDARFRIEDEFYNKLFDSSLKLNTLLRKVKRDVEHFKKLSTKPGTDANKKLEEYKNELEAVGKVIESSPFSEEDRDKYLEVMQAAIKKALRVCKDESTELARENKTLLRGDITTQFRAIERKAVTISKYSEQIQAEKAVVSEKIAELKRILDHLATLEEDPASSLDMTSNLSSLASLLDVTATERSLDVTAASYSLDATVDTSAVKRELFPQPLSVAAAVQAPSAQAATAGIAAAPLRKGDKAPKSAASSSARTVASLPSASGAEKPAEPSGANSSAPHAGTGLPPTRPRVLPRPASSNPMPETAAASSGNPSSAAVQLVAPQPAAEKPSVPAAAATASQEALPQPTSSTAAKAVTTFKAAAESAQTHTGAAKPESVQPSRPASVRSTRGYAAPAPKPQEESAGCCSRKPKRQDHAEPLLGS